MTPRVPLYGCSPAGVGTPLVESLTSFLGIVYPDDRFAPVYARLLAGLQRGGEIIATMDLMIATAAIVDEAALATRNRKHFERVPGVDVVSS